MSRLDNMKAEIRRLAGIKRHTLTDDMIRGEKLNEVQAELVIAHLNHCRDLFPSAAPVAPITPGSSQIAPRPVPQTAPSRPAPKNPARSARPDVPGLAALKHIPAGYYATPREDSEVIDFWKVEKGEPGQWEGFSFARRVLGGQTKDARKLRTEKITNIQQRLALQAIDALGLEEAQQLFADKLDRCIDCSTPLTNDVSRGRRRGPDCYDKFIASH